MLDNMSVRNGFPWMAKGRWYKFFIESDGNDYTITSADLDGASITSNKLKLPSHYHVISIAGDVHSIDEGSSSNAMVPCFFADDTQGVILPNKNTFDYADIWVFSYSDGGI